MLLRYLIWAAGISFATCVIQEITLYSEPGFVGDSLTLRSKRPSFTPELESFVQSAKSWCEIGRWKGYSAVDFLGTLILNSGAFETARLCRNGTLSTVKSLRYCGPLDTTTWSISFYKGSPDGVMGGDEVILTTATGSNFGFPPTGTIVTGPSNWTLFPNPDFSGAAICLVGTLELHAFAFNSTTRPASVVLGCNPRKVSSYITLTD